MNPSQDQRQTVMQHLSVLRKMLISSAIASAAAFRNLNLGNILIDNTIDDYILRHINTSII